MSVDFVFCFSVSPCRTIGTSDDPVQQQQWYQLHYPCQCHQVNCKYLFYYFILRYMKVYDISTTFQIFVLLNNKTHSLYSSLLLSTHEHNHVLIHESFRKLKHYLQIQFVDSPQLYLKGHTNNK